MSKEPNKITRPETFWSLHFDFLALPAEEVLKRNIEDDCANYDKALASLGNALKVVDDLLVFYVGVVQEFYRSLPRWQDNTRTRCALEMLTGALNYFLLTRHAMLLGYYPEAQGILRDAYERFSRVPVFLLKRDLAERFLAGKEIKQAHVDKALASILERDDAQVAQTFQKLRDHYGNQSSDVHPNLTSASIVLRHPSIKGLAKEEARRVVGQDIAIGGLIGPETGRLTLMSLSSSLIIASAVAFRALEASGVVEDPERLQEIRKAYGKLRDEVMKQGDGKA